MWELSVRVLWTVVVDSNAGSFRDIIIDQSLVLWLNLPAWKVGDRGFEHRSVVQVSKKQIVSSVLTRKYLILWGAFMTGRQRARPRTVKVRILYLVYGAQCHLIYLTILRRLSWPSIQWYSLYVHRWPKTPLIHSLNAETDEFPHTIPISLLKIEYTVISLHLTEVF